MKCMTIGSFRVVNRKKFARFLVVLSILLVIGVYSTSLVINEKVTSLTSQDLSESDLEFISKFDLIEITVNEGDVSWNIQKLMTPNYDVREMLYYGKKLNGKSMGNIVAGENIVFLKEKGIN